MDNKSLSKMWKESGKKIPFAEFADRFNKEHGNFKAADGSIMPAVDPQNQADLFRRGGGIDLPLDTQIRTMANAGQSTVSEHLAAKDTDTDKMSMAMKKDMAFYCVLGITVGVVIAVAVKKMQ
jgi:hypothetical protein